MTATTLSPFEAADRLAPPPATEQESTPAVWLRHYTAQAVACYAEFTTAIDTIAPDAERGSRRDIGYLSALGVASTAAAVALAVSPASVAELLWDITPELGALNGEWEHWLAETLDEVCGINPADIDPHYRAADFTSPSRLAELEAQS